MPRRISLWKFALLVVAISLGCFAAGAILSPGPDFTHRLPFGISMAAAMLLSIGAMKKVHRGQWPWFLHS